MSKVNENKQIRSNKFVLFEGIGEGDEESGTSQNGIKRKIRKTLDGWTELTWPTARSTYQIFPVYSLQVHFCERSILGSVRLVKAITRKKI